MSLFSGSNAGALDYPHSALNSIGCESCHFVYADEPSHLPPWTSHEPQNIDDTQYNTLCWSCHNDTRAPYMRTHSSLQIDDSYGDWSVECRLCHNPHMQKQMRTYGSESYLYSGNSTAIEINHPEPGKSQLFVNGADWAENKYQGLVLIPNTNAMQIQYGYKILSNTSDTLTVSGVIDLTQVTPGEDPFAIIYGKLINSSVRLDLIINPGEPKTGNKAVKFFNETGPNSFADGDSAFDGICEVCHTMTTHFRSNGEGSDPLHSNVGSPAGTNCTRCHPHIDGFRHGGGSSGAGCEECHGHDPGYEGFTGGKGSYKSHSTHTEDDADDLRGPHVNCDVCHDTGNFPYFKSGTDINGDGRYSLFETDVCDECHSPDGKYDGVNDPVVGVKYGNNGEFKYNWLNRIYREDGRLKTEKEKWCATCHDEAPSRIFNVDAPNVIGDEDSFTNYGIGYGFYKTGHGLPSNKNYPASGESVAGAGLSCDYCHDLSMKHTDGVERTYAYTASEGDDNDYQHGYRLKLIDGQLPMTLPRTGTCADSGVNVSEFRLCFSCHESEPFTDSSNYETNFRRTGSPDFNAHAYHLGIKFLCDYGPVFRSDWRSHGNDSRASCITCHNVHGSEQLSMVRDGKLINSEPGLRVLYYRPGVSFDCFNYPDLRDVSLPESTGTIYDPNAGGLCSTCHGSCGFDTIYYRAVSPEILEVRGQAGSSTVTVTFSEGVYSEPGAAGDLTADDFLLTDLDDERFILNVSHAAGEARAIVTLNEPLDESDDINVDTLSSAGSYSIYDSSGMPMDVTPVAITGPGEGSHTLILHPSGSDSTIDCTAMGGTWGDILDSDDGDISYADCSSYFDAPSSQLHTAQFSVNMDDPSGLEGAAITRLSARAVIDITGVSGGAGPSGPLAYAQICYNTGGASRECSAVYDLDGTEGYIEIWVGNTVDPDGNLLDMNDLNNLQVEVVLNADDCCSDAAASARVTEVYAEVDYLAPSDSTAPVISARVPAHEAVDIDAFNNLTFTISDSGSGINWTTFEIEITGSKGYSKLYTDADFIKVTKTGHKHAYNVTVNPDENFSGEEIITVTVRIDDYAGNSLDNSEWSFTTARAPVVQTLILHPSGIAYDGGFSVTGGTWSDVLDTNDGDVSHVYFCCSSPGQTFYVELDDPAISDVVIQNLTVHVYARYVDGVSPSPPAIQGDMDIGYRTGTATIWKGNTLTDGSGAYNLISSDTYTLDSDSGALDLSDINNLQIAVKRNTSGSANLRVTEIYVEVAYFPLGGDADPPTASIQAPSPGAEDIGVNSDLTFTLEDSGSGVDWTTFSIQLSGDKGYARTYSDLDTSIVIPTGTPGEYNVIVSPDTEFNYEEVITVTVNVDDVSGNSLTAFSWSFTTAASVLPQTITLHSSGLASSTSSWSTSGGDWPDVLDSNDGDSSYAVLCCTSSGWAFYSEMDNPVGLESAVIQSITFHVYARYRNSPSPGGTPMAADIEIGYMTGAHTVWAGNFTTDSSSNYTLISSTSYVNDSDGGPLDLTDINNLQIAVKRNISGSPQIRVTEVYAEITYLP